MKLLHSSHLYRIKIFFFVLFISFSCNIEPNFISEEALLTKIQQEKRDSIAKQVKELNKRGTFARNDGDYKSALNLHFEALTLAESAKDSMGLIYALNNIGTDLRRTYSNIEASSYHFLALELSSSNEKYLSHQAVAMNGLGNIFLALEKPEQARSYFMDGLEIAENEKNKLGVAINLANIAETYIMDNEIDSAFYYYNRSLLKNISINSKIGEALCKRSMGLIYLKKERKDRALQLLNEAYSIIENSKDAFHKLEIRTSLAETLINLESVSEAEPHVIEIIALSGDINSYDYQQKGYEMMAKIKEKQQLFREAFEAKELGILYRDSVSTQNSEVRILELENRYKGKEAAQKIELLTTEKALTEKNKTEQQRIFFLLLLLLFVFIGFQYYRYHNKVKISRELEKINEIKSRFFGNISHEFRTPLTLIKGPLEKWLNSDLSPELEKDARIMLHNSEQLLFLVDQLLSLSKLDSGSFKINPQYADLSLALKGIANFFLHIVAEKAINYKVDIQSSGKNWVDLHIVEIIVTNFLSNALKFTNKNGNISIIGENKNNGYEVRVANSGKRLSPDELSKLFDRFYTNVPSHYSGSGIGLSLVKELSTLYGSTVSVIYNKKDEIEFKVVFPPLQVEEEISAEDIALENLVVDRFHVFREGSVKDNDKLLVKPIVDSSKYDFRPLLLVVEDNEDLRRYVIDSFLQEYNIIEAEDGEEGIELANMHIPDLIITDIMMPKIDGLELCNTLKTSPTTNHIPIIILTALNEERDLLAGLKNKADDYVTKPFGTNVLKQKVKNLIEIRKVLSAKYRKEIILKPLNLLISDGEDDFAIMLKEVIENKIKDPNFGVDEFCSVAAMSRSQLYRKLKATVDMSVSEFIRVHRVKLASELFQNKNLNVTDVCYASGFTDTSYFSKSFKEVFKIPPAEFRKRLHEERVHT